MTVRKGTALDDYDYPTKADAGKGKPPRTGLLWIEVQLLAVACCVVMLALAIKTVFRGSPEDARNLTLIAAVFLGIGFLARSSWRG